MRWELVQEISLAISAFLFRSATIGPKWVTSPYLWG
jgi:hypothetical protein